MKQTLKSEHLTNVACLHVIISEQLLENDSNSLEDTCRDLDAILLFEELQHSIAIELFCLCACNEVSLSCNLAAVRENDGASIIIQIVVFLHFFKLFLESLRFFVSVCFLFFLLFLNFSALSLIEFICIDV